MTELQDAQHIAEQQQSAYSRASALHRFAEVELEREADRWEDAGCPDWTGQHPQTDQVAYDYQRAAAWERSMRDRRDQAYRMLQDAEGWVRKIDPAAAQA